MEKKFYIYVLLDQREEGIWEFNELIFNNKPFYIGKGCGRRMFNHFCNSSLNVVSFKNKIIKKIKNELGELPIHYRIYDNLTEEESFIIETNIIRHFGKITDGGILVNMTDGGEGHSGYNEPKTSHYKKTYQYDLSGNFIKEWESLSQIQSELSLNIGNISTAIKRNGTASGYRWFYKFKGEIIKSKIKAQMPIKYKNIKQIDIKTNVVINIFDSALEIENSLNLRKGGRNKIYESLNNKNRTAYGYKWEI